MYFRPSYSDHALWCCHEASLRPSPPIQVTIACPYATLTHGASADACCSSSCFLFRSTMLRRPRQWASRLLPLRGLLLVYREPWRKYPPMPACRSADGLHETVNRSLGDGCAQFSHSSVTRLFPDRAGGRVHIKVLRITTYPAVALMDA